MENEIREAIKELVEKAKNTRDANDALKFSQSALNLAHTLATLKVI